MVKKSTVKAKLRRKKKGYDQTGTSNKEIDKKLLAKKVGWRTAKKSKRRYFENRANRSDKNKKTGL